MSHPLNPKPRPSGLRSPRQFPGMDPAALNLARGLAAQHARERGGRDVLRPTVRQLTRHVCDTYAIVREDTPAAAATAYTPGDPLAFSFDAATPLTNVYILGRFSSNVPPLIYASGGEYASANYLSLLEAWLGPYSLSSGTARCALLTRLRLITADFDPATVTYNTLPTTDGNNSYGNSDQDCMVSSSLNASSIAETFSTSAGAGAKRLFGNYQTTTYKKFYGVALWLLRSGVTSVFDFSCPTGYRDAALWTSLPVTWP